MAGGMLWRWCWPCCAGAAYGCQSAVQGMPAPLEGTCTDRSTRQGAHRNGLVLGQPDVRVHSSAADTMSFWNRVGCGAARSSYCLCSKRELVSCNSACDERDMSWRTCEPSSWISSSTCPA